METEIGSKTQSDTKKKLPDGSATALCSTATALFALLLGFLGYTTLKSDTPWTLPDLFWLILPAIAAGAALISVPFLAIREPKTEAVESLRWARIIFTVGSCLVALVIFTWFIRDFLANHGEQIANSGVYRVGENTYQVATRETSALSGRIGAMRMAVKEANDYCSKQVKQLKVIKETDDCGDFQRGHPEPDIQL